MSAEHPTHAPVVLGDRYRLDGLIGSGGMGRVHRAWDQHLGRRVAIKVLAPELAADPAVSARLRAEGRLLATLQHPNLVTLHDIPDDDAVTYLVMELVEGESLADRLRRDGPLATREVSAIITGVAAGLSALHGAGIVHGDVSPANVLLGVDGRARLADLGLARDAASPIPAPDGLIHGTLRYLAPERVDGAAPSAAADVYALAAVTYAALLGRPPAVATDVIKLRAALAEPPIRPSLLRPGLAPALDEALLAALGPADGRPDAYHFAVALAHALRASSDPAGPLATTTLVTAPAGIRYRTLRGGPTLGRGRRSALALTAGALLLVVGGAGVAGLDALIARPGLPVSEPITATVETPDDPTDREVAAPAPSLTLTAAAQLAPGTGATSPDRTQAATGGAVTATVSGLSAIARPVASLRAAAISHDLARAVAGLQPATTPRQHSARIPAVRHQVIPVVRLPVTVATVPAVRPAGSLALGDDVEQAAGSLPGTRAAVTTRFAADRGGAAATSISPSSTTTSVVRRPSGDATVVRGDAEHAGRSGSGEDDRTDRSGRSPRSGHEDEHRAVRESSEDDDGSDESDDGDRSGKG